MTRSAFLLTFFAPASLLFLLGPLERRFGRLLADFSLPRSPRCTPVIPTGGIGLWALLCFALPFTALPPRALLGLLGGGWLLTVGGFLDDLKGLSVKARLTLQSLAALFALLPLLPFYRLLPALLFTVVMTNVLDRLEDREETVTGYGLMSALSLAGTALRFGREEIAFPLLLLGGGCLGLLLHCLPKGLPLGHPGAQLLGFLPTVLATALPWQALLFIMVLFLYPLIEGGGMRVIFLLRDWLGSRVFSSAKGRGFFS